MMLLVLLQPGVSAAQIILTDVSEIRATTIVQDGFASIEAMSDRNVERLIELTEIPAIINEL